MSGLMSAAENLEVNLERDIGADWLLVVVGADWCLAQV